MARGVWLGSVVAGLALSWLQIATAAEVGGIEAAIQQHVAAGEFDPARKLAERIDDRTLRDQQLSHVGLAQFAAGERKSALATVDLISDERTKALALKKFAEELITANVAAGGVEADFDSLMELIVNTVAPETWDEVGGPGTMSPFVGGVFVDAHGTLRRTELRPSNKLGAVAKASHLLKADANRPRPGDVKRRSTLRKISLPKLERAVQARLAAGQLPTDEMRYMAGLEKIRYVFVYPQTQEVVMAGPAGDWQRSVEGRLVSVESGRPLLQLDDLVVVLRQLRSSVGATFGCSITPSRDNLALTQQFLDASRGTPLKSGARDAWLGELRTKLGRQNIEVFGIDPRTRAAQVMVEADYRMKLIGMGLEEGVLGVDSYLDSISLKPGESPPPLDVLRWWFAMNYAAIQCTPNRQAFELHGQGVRVLCENELLDAGGERIHTGEATALNHLFAQNFTEHFAKLAVKYPVYAELQNVFDLALALALIRAEGLADLANWQAPCFIGDNTYRVATRRAPQTVETVMNHRVINKRHIIVGVSGGVRVDPWQLVKNVATESDNYGKLNDAHKAGSAPADTQPDRWWWD